MNAVDKNSAGDYLVSGRHTSTIYKVSGESGKILWQVGGISSDYTMAGGLNFSSQHHCRFQQENETTTVISLFDNASNGYKQTASYSSGKIIAVSHDTNHATLIQKYISPGKRISSSQGSIQVLDNGNVYAGWGSNAYISEYLADGTLVLEGHFATTGAMHYRSYKFNFTSRPTDAPTAYAYARNKSAPTGYYMSWNGATEVAHWRIYVSANASGPYLELQTVPKTGFETMFTAPNYHEWSIMAALGSNGEGLANSSRPIRTFVPGPALAEACDEVQCAVATGYSQQAPAVSAHTGEATGTGAAPMPSKNGGAHLDWHLCANGRWPVGLVLVVVSWMIVIGVDLGVSLA